MRRLTVWHGASILLYAATACGQQPVMESVQPDLAAHPAWPKSVTSESVPLLIHLSAGSEDERPAKPAAKPATAKKAKLAKPAESESEAASSEEEADDYEPTP